MSRMEETCFYIFKVLSKAQHTRYTPRYDFLNIMAFSRIKEIFIVSGKKRVHIRRKKMIVSSEWSSVTLYNEGNAI